MEKDEYVQFLEARDLCVSNLRSLKMALEQSLDDKRIDLENELYDQLLVFLDGAPVIESWEELEDVIERAKMLEREIDEWLSIHELTSYSLSWPKRQRGFS